MQTISADIREKLGMKLSSVGVMFSDNMPDDAVYFKKKGSGCIVLLIFKSARGKIVAFNDNTTGWPCSSFYLGYSEWIFPGIEKFLSNETVQWREPERFFKSPEIAKKFVESFIPEEKRNNTIIFKPLELFEKDKKPKLVIFFANADQLSALVYLINYSNPFEERGIGRLLSVCMSIFTVPLKYAVRRRKKAVWGLHDISVRNKLPRELMTLTLTCDLFEEVYSNMEDSFINTETRERLKRRNQ